MGLSYSHGREFVTQLRPLLEQHDVEALTRFLGRHWSNAALRGLLDCGHEDAVKVAILCLAITGSTADSQVIARSLQDDDSELAELAERALWLLWFRAGDDQGNSDLMRAVRLIDQGRLAEAAELLGRVIARCPGFSEAYHQRAIVCFLAEDYAGAADHFRAALRTNRYHFGALAGLGHSLAAMGRLPAALAAYQTSLTLHPRMPGVREAIQQVRVCMHPSPVSSGSPSSNA